MGERVADGHRRAGWLAEGGGKQPYSAHASQNSRWYRWNPLESVAISGNPWQSVAISGTP